MESGNRRCRSIRRRLQTAHDIVGPGINQQAAETADLPAQRPHRVADAAPLAQALIGANADRIIWGTDWPHPDSVTPPGRQPTEVTPLFQIDDGRLLNQLPVWAPDAAIRKKILVDNPARLYGF